MSPLSSENFSRPPLRIITDQTFLSSGPLLRPMQSLEHERAMQRFAFHGWTPVNRDRGVNSLQTSRSIERSDLREPAGSRVAELSGLAEIRPIHDALDSNQSYFPVATYDEYPAYPSTTSQLERLSTEICPITLLSVAQMAQHNRIRSEAIQTSQFFDEGDGAESSESRTNISCHSPHQVITLNSNFGATNIYDYHALLEWGRRGPDCLRSLGLVIDPLTRVNLIDMAKKPVDLESAKATGYLNGEIIRPKKLDLCVFYKPESLNASDQHIQPTVLQDGESPLKKSKLN